MKNLISNKKSSMQYIIEDSIEAGMILRGYMVKAIYNASISISSSYVVFNMGIPVLVGVTIEGNSIEIPLLLKKREIQKMKKYMENPGNTLIPLSIYNVNRRFIKVSIGYVKGRKKQDKREYLKEKDFKKESQIKY